MKQALISVFLLLVFSSFAYSELNIELLGILEGEYDGDLFGHCVANLGDINGDGYEDFGVGAPYYPEGTDTGRVYIYLGSENFDLNSDLILENPREVEWFGWSVCGLKDVNADGCDEFLVGAFGHAVFLYFGGDPPDGVPDRVFSELGHAYGAHIASGDVNNDGTSDIVVARRERDTACVYLGSEVMDTVADFVLVEYQVGIDGIASGDVNGDDYDDIVAARGYDGTYQSLLYLGRDSLYSEPDLVFDRIFSRGAVGDVNGDGYADIITYCRLYFGADEIDTSNYLTLPKAQWTTQVGQINKDRYGDIITRRSDPFGSWAQVHIYLGGSEPDNVDDWSSFRTSDNLGYSIAAVDINSDGVDEFLLGDPYYLNDSRRGAAYVYSGDTTTLAVDDIAASLPDDIVLEQNYPNPFNTRTVIEFAVSRLHVSSSLKIYNSSGQLVKTLLEMPLIPGRYHYAWDSTNELGEEVSSGVYFISLRSGDMLRTRKALLIK